MPSFYDTCMPATIRALQNAAAFLAIAEKQAQENSIDPNEYTTARLYPDMRDLCFQVYTFTNGPCTMVSKITGAEPLEQENAETTFPDLIKRIERTLEWLQAVDEKDFDGKEDKEVVIEIKMQAGPMAGKTMRLEYTALDFVNYFAMPNIWFHVTTAYDILRSKGVKVGKNEFLNAAGHMKVEIL
ncbi:hypothetical protein M011DRAFT_445545 [Sporormia fimetaria CBS 119925]|uniref:Uncharacterized protein n=1 Tax=Sporormia fimetaria CBS 119925 TaxID=1340428 RepID=A0A6A6V9I8_9PLEO|nr:hypothetical protein M011DRAFT_445545 [Sporormia fimetaria CBS 119925]